MLHITGLSSEEAASRLKSDGPNLLPASVPKSSLTITLEVIAEPMFLMLLFAGGVYLALGDGAEAMILLGFVFVVIGITLAQKRKTQRALEALRDLSATRALVIRDGLEQRIAGLDVVRGDVLVLREGNRIVADAVMLSGLVEVDESLLTGESASVTRYPSQEQVGCAGTGMLYASTVVTRGDGLAQVCDTATATAVGRIGADLAATEEPPSPLQDASQKFVRNLGLGALTLAVLQVWLGWWWNGHDLLDSLLGGISLAMAILPEEIPVILTVFLALGAWRLSKQRVLTRRVSAVEALGAITVLAVDKTGTLTGNQMAVVELASESDHFILDGAATLEESFHGLLEFAMLASRIDPYDPMEQAIQHFGHHWLSGTEHIHDGRVPQFEYALSGEILAITRVYASARPSAYLLATKGAPEAVVDLCHLDHGRREAIRSQVETIAGRGLRVLGVARGRWSGTAAGPDEDPPWPPGQHDFDFEFLGLVALADPPRPEVPAALSECRRAGIRVIMMTGDHAATARAIARQVGLSDHAGVITGPEVAEMNDAALQERLKQVDLCARLLPAQKLRLVQALQASGEVVGMTGDGVNDAPALKAADVGIAMGLRGTDVAREAAALVLLDDSFSGILHAIRQGRRIDDNIRKATRFVFAVHLPIIALTLVPALLQWPVLLMPVHIALMQLLIDPACSIIFEADQESPGLMARAPRPGTDSPFSGRIVISALLQGLGVAVVLLLGHAWMVSQAWPEVQGRSVVIGSLVLDVLLLIVANRDRGRPAAGQVNRSNPWVARMGAAIVLILVSVVSVPWLANVMRMTWPGVKGLVVVIVLLAASYVWLELLRRTGNRRTSLFHSISNGGMDKVAKR